MHGWEHGTVGNIVERNYDILAFKPCTLNPVARLLKGNAKEARTCGILYRPPTVVSRKASLTEPAEAGV